MRRVSREGPPLAASPARKLRERGGKVGSFGQRCRALAELDGGHGCGLLAPDCMPIHQPVDLLGLEPPVAVQVPLGEVGPHDLGEPLAGLEPKAPRRGEGQ